MPNHFLGVEGATVSFGQRDAQVRALRDVSQFFERGTLSLVMGPSGSGKTTLLSLLGCLLTPDEGTVFVDGVAINGGFAGFFDRSQRVARLLWGKLERLVGHSEGIRFSEHIEGDGAIIFAHACKLGLEGIVSKRRDLPYRSGRSKCWIKIKNPGSPAVLRIQDGTW